ncbi:MAG: class I SAM-dependent methyltransferase [Johnsonella sp.]|nr:class I SAM-dependent methyltransferase [Johnsonella sp.]
MKIKLEGVMKTLLITLDIRAKDYKAETSVLKDKKSAEIVEQIDYDFSSLENDDKNYIGILARAKIMDREVLKFMQKYPDCHIVSLGSGLDTRFHRVDNGKIHWYDVDFPEVIELRKKFFEENDRVKLISKSVSDPSWAEEIQNGDKKLLIISEGMIMYLAPEEVKKFLHILTDHFDSFELHLDCVPNNAVNRARRNKAVKKTKSEYLFGSSKGKEILALNPKLKQIGNINFTDEFKNLLKGFQKIFIPLIYLFNDRLLMFTYKAE